MSTNKVSAGWTVGGGTTIVSSFAARSTFGYLPVFLPFGACQQYRRGRVPMAAMIRRTRESGGEMNIHQATQSYENWMRSCTSVVEAHLRLKDKQMRKGPFLFTRGTFYRWAKLWPEVCANLRDAPKVLAVGDLHVGNLGAWRDTQGRL